MRRVNFVLAPCREERATQREKEGRERGKCTSGALVLALVRALVLVRARDLCRSRRAREFAAQ